MSQGAGEGGPRGHVVWPMFFPLSIHYYLENTSFAPPHPQMASCNPPLLLHPQENTDACDLCDEGEHELGDYLDHA